MVDEKEAVCNICGRSRPRGQLEIIQLTVKEKEYYRRIGQEVLSEYAFCRPCWRVMSDPAKGPALIKSLFEISLSRSGVQNAEQIAKQYHTWLVKKAVEPKSS